MSKGLKGFAAVTVVVMFLVLVAGTLVTKTGSGEGCGASWPLCHGQLLPESNFQSIVEYSHRAVTGVAGLMVFALAIWVWRRFPHRSDMRWLAGGAIFFLLLQSGLGAWAVLAPQSPLVMALHFGISLMSFSTVLLPYILLEQLDAGTTHRHVPVSSRLKAWVWGSLILAYAVVYTGAYVRHTGAMAACPDWPLCGGALIPQLSGLVGIHFTHRLGALLALLAIVILWRVAAQEKHRRPDVYAGSLAALVTIILQVLTGGIMVWSRLSLTWMMIHSSVIIVHFGALSYLALQVTEEPVAGSREALPASRKQQPLVQMTQ